MFLEQLRDVYCKYCIKCSINFQLNRIPNWNCFQKAKKLKNTHFLFPNFFFSPPVVGGGTLCLDTIYNIHPWNNTEEEVLCEISQNHNLCALKNMINVPWIPHGACPAPSFLALRHAPLTDAYSSNPGIGASFLFQPKSKNGCTYFYVNYCVVILRSLMYLLHITLVLHFI